MLVDEVTITVKAGNGGNGAATFRQNEGNPRGGPDGGNGGNGGNVYFQGVDDFTALAPFQYKKTVRAEDGVSGKRKNLFGKNADDLIVSVPVGTIITDTASGQTYEIKGTEGKLLIARGGTGGRGNNEFKSATNQAPRYAENGGEGEEKSIHLELRLIANIGLIGLPNAGKSSLLAMLTNATPKIAHYPFTTLEPNLGMLERIVIADIPGLIEGASSGKGLGIKFLKHIERTKLLVHCIDSTSDDVLRDYETVRKEFTEYNTELLDKEEIILLTKTDLLSPKEITGKIKSLNKLKKRVHTVSMYDDEQVTAIGKLLRSAMEVR
jgi:GTP-binding protein